jgi:YihY family inner membrane protein
MRWARELSTWTVRLGRFSLRVARAFLHNRGLLLAGGVGYNALLSIVPFVTLTVAALSRFFDEDRIVGTLRPELNLLVPQHADTLLQTTLGFLRHQTAIGAVSVGLLLFFCSLAFRMLEEAVAVIFTAVSAGTERHFLVSAVLPYLFIIPLMASVFLLTVVTIGLGALATRSVDLFGVTLSLGYGVNVALRLAGFLGMVGLFTGLYRILPVVRVSVGRAFIGGLCAAVLWKGASTFMVYYFTNISEVNLIYGSLATVIVVLLFLEVAFVILLIGAQVIAELEASSAAGVPWHQAPSS